MNSTEPEPKKQKTASNETQELEANPEKSLEQRLNDLEKRFEIEKQERDALKKRLNGVENRLNGVENRLNGFVKIMSPATLFAKLETAVYEFTAANIPSGWEENEDNIKHHVASFCFNVLVDLRDNTENKIDLNWPRKKKPKQSFPKNAKFSLVKAGLRGVTIFVSDSSKEELKNLNKDNKLVHDGKYLDSMFPPDTSNYDDSETYEFTRSKIDGFRNLLKNDSDSASNYDLCLEELVKALVSKGFDVKVEDGIKAFLNEVGPPH